MEVQNSSKIVTIAKILTTVLDAYGDYVNLLDFERDLEAWIFEVSGDAVLLKAEKICSDIALYPEEERFVLNAVISRKAEFATGRSCARKIMAKFGHPGISIPVGLKGEPLWPKGVSGSISHDQGIAVAIGSTDCQFAGLGIDLLGSENCIDSAGRGLIADESEIGNAGSMLERHTSSLTQGVDPVLLIFSAKESAIKAVSPSLGHYLDFREIRILPRPDYLKAVFEDLDISLKIHWTLINGFIITFTCLLANPANREKVSNPG